METVFVFPVFFIGVFKTTAYNYSCIRPSYTTLREIISCCRGHTDIGSVPVTLCRFQIYLPGQASCPDPDSQGDARKRIREGAFSTEKILANGLPKGGRSPLKGLTP
jgi:hypothetical protein